MTPLRLGIIGLSEGNGHPYSWSAIFNGYDKSKMAQCPFPVIPQYLACQEFPRDQLRGGRVTHIWTQDPVISRQVAEAALIEQVVDNYQDMIGAVDGVLMARDDAEHHYEMAAPFVRAGLPIYIDKPLALTQAEAKRILALQVYPSQVFSCSALAFAKELMISDAVRARLGRLRRVEARIANSWEKYAIHIIEPVLNLIDKQGRMARFERTDEGEQHCLKVTWGSGLETSFTTTGNMPTSPEINIFGDREEQKLVFTDAFAAFKAALEQFVSVARRESESIPHDFMLKAVRIIEMGVDLE